MRGLQRTPRGNFPLENAAKKCQVAVVKKLIEYGAIVDAKGENELTPLHSAVQKGYLDICKLLLSYNANINGVQSNGSGDTPLHESAGRGHSDITNLLISKGGNIHARDSRQFTPLHCASQEGRAEEVGSFLNRRILNGFQRSNS